MDEDDLDLSGVHPLLWNRARARVAAIKAYLSLARPTSEDEARYAKQLGISSSHFSNLVRIWLRHKSAAALPGSSIHTSGHPARRRQLSPEATAIVASAIEELGPHTDAIEVRREVQRRCEAASIKPPHLNTTRTHMQMAREAAAALPGSHDTSQIVIDHCAVELPVIAGEDQAQLPVLTLAITVPELIIVAHSVALAGPTAPRTAELIIQLIHASEAGAPPRQIRMNSGQTPGWRSLVANLRAAGADRIGTVGTPIPSGREITRLLGRSLGQLRLRPKLTHKAAKLSKWASYQKAITAADLGGAVADAVREHNSKSRSEQSGFTITPSTSRNNLLEDLRVVAESQEEPRPRNRK